MINRYVISPPSNSSLQRVLSFASGDRTKYLYRLIVKAVYKSISFLNEDDDSTKKTKEKYGTRQ